jgi:hypothetical protein
MYFGKENDMASFQQGVQTPEPSLLLVKEMAMCGLFILIATLDTKKIKKKK